MAVADTHNLTIAQREVLRKLNDDAFDHIPNCRDRYHASRKFNIYRKRGLDVEAALAAVALWIAHRRDAA